MGGPTDQARKSTDVSMTEHKRIDETEARLIGAYHPVQYAFVQFLTEHLSDLMEPFDQDLGQMLVLAVLGQRRLEAHAQGHATTEENPARSSMTASRIADVARMPRETVRRKLIALQARGWIGHDPAHGWYVAGLLGDSPARQALSEHEKRFFRRLARLHVSLCNVMETKLQSATTPARD